MIRLQLKALLAILCSVSLLAACGKQETTTPEDEVPAQNPAFNTTQILTSLAFLPDLNSGFVGSRNELETHAKVSTALLLSKTRSYIGNWKVAWGPAIYAADTTSYEDCPDGSKTCVTSNLMVVLQPTSPIAGMPDYIIALSGTDYASPFGWIVEDFDVSKGFTWPSPPT